MPPFFLEFFMNIMKSELRSFLRGEPKTERLTFLLSPREKKEIRQAARKLNTTMSGYIVSLHKFALSRDSQ